jgi:hypothetical protein
MRVIAHLYNGRILRSLILYVAKISLVSTVRASNISISIVSASLDTKMETHDG